MALSYTWGDPRRFKNGPDFTLEPGPLENGRASGIQNGEFQLPITDNLYNALVTWRRIGAPYPLWVDAISINQDGLTKHSDQIPLVAEIYSRAWVV